MAALAASPPSFSEARLTPSASRSPNPSRWLIICSSRLAPATSPHLRSKPTCCFVSQPFSRPSITQPITQPNSLTSTHARSVCVFSQATALWSVPPIVQPSPDQPSYSGSSTVLPLYGPCRRPDLCQWCMPPPSP